ncbi:MAG: PKD domain-containing protein, partial [Bacteroidota bacterium]
MQTVRNAVVTGVALAVIFLTNYDAGNPDAGLIRLESRDGAGVISTADSVVNQYASLSSDASSGTNIVAVSNIADLNGGSALAFGDLVMVMQMQGATINIAQDTSYGRVSSYGSAGRYEFAHVAGVSGNNITLQCALKHDYFTAGHTQVIRVPQYTTLTINSGASVTASAWDGSTGGIVAIAAENTITVDSNGEISVEGKGFRGGTRRNTATYGITTYYSATESHGGEKGEGIVGYQTEYDALGGRYGRGAPANGGGGGNAHNTGGGGGANGHSGIVWNGQGNMCSGCVGAAAWALDDAYIANGNALTTSSGGGRGGYAFANTNGDALTLGPGEATWGGDSRLNLGGLGGRPLTVDPSERLFLGGGGGAGSGNNSASEDGASGGGMIFLIADSITGSGTLNADGGDAAPTLPSHNDAPGGGGGGGTIVIKSNNVSGVSAQANGGNGGDQLITGGESEGPGGGGGGGFIALPSRTDITTSILGASGGVTNSSALTEFPSNGATDGGDGQVSTVDYIIFCNEPDLDQDGVADVDDLDDDNDGIPDWQEVGCTSLADFESGACPDPSAKNASGTPNYKDPTFCSGGTLVNGVCPEYDTDGDGVPDFLDRDSDQDGIPDLIEAGGIDQDGDGNVDCYGPGTAKFTVKLTVTDNEGAIRTVEEIISLGSNPPQATYTATPGSGASWAQVSFDGTGSTDNGSISSYSWDLGDGNTSTSNTFSHTYADPGTYTVVLTVTDNDGLKDSYTQWITLY